MNVLVIGGSGFIGSRVVSRLLHHGHVVFVLHRGQNAPVEKGVREIRGDRRNPGTLAEAATRVSANVALDMIPYTLEDGQAASQELAGRVDRLVTISSIDVYLAFGRIWKTEPGSPLPVPLNEDAPLRATDKPHGPKYDKISVERAARTHPDLRTTILRLPAVYGPGDRQHRLGLWTHAIRARRPAILLPEELAHFRFTHAYVEDVADAITLATEKESASGKTYNLGEIKTPTQLDRFKTLAKAAGWEGRVVTLPNASCPEHLQQDLNYAQDWVVDTSRLRCELGFAEGTDSVEALLKTMDWEVRSAPVPSKEAWDAEDSMINQTGPARR